MAEEIEAKVRIADPDGFRRRMESRAGPGRGPVFEVNRLFDDAAGRLRRAGSALRLREEFAAGGGRAERTILTFKGPRRPGPLKRRPEFETEAASAEAMVAVLEAIGLAETFRYEKRRTSWHAGDCEVTLDELPHLGWFAEVEGPSEAAVCAALADLGLAAEPLVPETYIQQLSDYLASAGLDPARAVF